MTLNKLTLNLCISISLIVSTASHPILGRTNNKKTIWRYASHTSDPFYAWKQQGIQHNSRKSDRHSEPFQMPDPLKRINCRKELVAGDTALNILSVKNTTFYTPRSSVEDVSRSIDVDTSNQSHSLLAAQFVAICIGGNYYRICRKQKRPGYVDVFLGFFIKVESVSYPL